MDEQEHKNLSIAFFSADLAWKLLTPEQQQQSLEYLKKVRKKEQISEQTQETCSIQGYSRLYPPVKQTRRRKSRF